MLILRFTQFWILGHHSVTGRSAHTAQRGRFQPTVISGLGNSNLLPHGKQMKHGMSFAEEGGKSRGNINKKLNNFKSHLLISCLYI